MPTRSPGFLGSPDSTRTPGPAEPPGSPITIGVYDEPELIVAGVAGLLERHDLRTRVALIEPSAAPRELDVVLCDPFGRSVDAEAYLGEVARATSARVIVYSWSTAATSVRRALAAGASAYVAKSAPASQLGTAVAAVHRGERVDPVTRTTPAGARPPLSNRESEVLGLICRGMSNLEIAAALFVSVNSVKTYIRQIYQKIDVTRRAQAVAWGLARGY